MPFGRIHIDITARSTALSARSPVSNLGAPSLIDCYLSISPRAEKGYCGAPLPSRQGYTTHQTRAYVYSCFPPAFSSIPHQETNSTMYCLMVRRVEGGIITILAVRASQSATEVSRYGSLWICDEVEPNVRIAERHSQLTKRCVIARPR